MSNQNGKGDKDRVKNLSKFRENYDQIKGFGEKTQRVSTATTSIKPPETKTA
jgi:hypothetical protein